MQNAPYNFFKCYYHKGLHLGLYPFVSKSLGDLTHTFSNECRNMLKLNLQQTIIPLMQNPIIGIANPFAQKPLGVLKAYCFQLAAKFA